MEQGKDWNLCNSEHFGDDCAARAVKNRLSSAPGACSLSLLRSERLTFDLVEAD